MASPSRSSKPPPPPPPPPPEGTTWDFLNLFEPNQSYYPQYTSSRSSKEVREEEGIPELEDEEMEVVKEAYMDLKLKSKSYAGGGTGASTSAAPPGEFSGKGERFGASFEKDMLHKSKKPTPVADNDNDDVEVVEKNVVADEPPKPAERWSGAAAPSTFRDASSVATEIKLQFERESETAGELAKMLEVGKIPYHQKHTLCHALRSICMIPSTSKDNLVLDLEENTRMMDAGNISSTLQKLYIWERKLYEEVKAEEKMRIIHTRQCKHLKHLDERGTESHKVESTQVMIRNLATKIRISMQIVDSISKKISRLRDEELWPQINELIQGFNRMWKLMMECHQAQHLAVSQVKSVDFVSATRKFSDNYMEAAVQLELELLEWIGNFCSWIIAQKSYIKALNEWLLRFLHHEPEETADGIAPFSPGRIGAPPVFVICNYWSQALERISEREVVHVMHVFASNIRHIWEQHYDGQKQRMMANRDMDEKLKTRERDAQMINKAMDALNKKLVLVSGQSELPIDHKEYGAGASDAQLGLEHLFEAMENFAASSVKAYEELHARAAEEMMSRGVPKGL